MLPNFDFFLRSSTQFKEQFIPPYTPMFKDGWVPPEVIAGKDVSNLSAAIAANAANAAAVAQLTDGNRRVRKMPKVLLLQNSHCKKQIS